MFAFVLLSPNVPEAVNPNKPFLISSALSSSPLCKAYRIEFTALWYLSDLISCITSKRFLSPKLVLNS